MTRLEIFGKPYQLPENWKECTPEQIQTILPLVMGQEPLPASRIAVLQHLVSPFISKKKISRLSSQERFDLLELVRWCWLTPMDSCPIEHFEFNGKKYYLPLKDFSHMAAVEFGMAHLHLQIFLRSSNSLNLDKLVATICRPLDQGKNVMDPNFDGERREKYSTPAADIRAKSFQNLNVATKVMVLQYFLDFQKNIYKSYDIFDKAPNSQGQRPGNESAVLWIKMLFDVAEIGVFGDIDKVYHTDIHTILFFLQKKKHDRHNMAA